jgi:hypothetical protein
MPEMTEQIRNSHGILDVQIMFQTNEFKILLEPACSGMPVKKTEHAHHLICLTSDLGRSATVDPRKNRCKLLQLQEFSKFFLMTTLKLHKPS